MDLAINKTTGKLISAFQIAQDSSYQNLDKNEWIAPTDKITNWDSLEKLGIKEIPIHYVKDSIYNKNDKVIARAPCFSLYPNSPAETIAESEEHKKYKNWLFNRLKNDDLIFIYSKGTKPHKYKSFVKLSELDIDWSEYQIPEETIKAHKKIRADILLPFKTRDSLFGNGIIFEIQLSNQNEEQTKERTLHRSLMGYSVVWLWEEDFIEEEDYLELKDNEISIIPFQTFLYKETDHYLSNIKKTVEEQSRLIDLKIEELINKTNKEIGITLQEVLKKKEYASIEIDNKSKALHLKFDDLERGLINKIEKLQDNPFTEIKESYLKQLQGKQEELKNYFILSNNALTEHYNKLKSKLNYPLTFGDCKKCNLGYMLKKKGKFGYFYSCSNWKSGCKNSINIGDDDETDSLY